jgi:peptidyl-prolyl cis-trans isomerase D
MMQGNIILQVLDRKAMMPKYKVAVVKREVVFSKETYNKAYNDFSQFIASNPTLEQLSANAEEAGYRLLDRNDLTSAEHGIGGIRATKEALRWVFAAKPGEVSGLYECGENDHMLVVGLAAINKEGYRPLEMVRDLLRTEVLRDKKAEKLQANLKDVKTIDQMKALDDAVSDSVKHVTFGAPAYVPMLRSSEPLVSAYASIAKEGEVSAPIKGNAGVFILQQYAQDATSETYNQADELTTIAARNARLSGQFIYDLTLKAKVKDTRYLFF